MLHSAVAKTQSNRKIFALAASLAASLVLFCSQAQAQDAQSITFHSKRTAHKVSGWEKGLVKRSPNLGKFYWTPMTNYTQTSGSRRTSKGAKQCGPTQTAARPAKRYVLSKFAPLPKNDRAQFSAEQLNAQTEVSLKFKSSKNQLASSRPSMASEDVSGVLTYGDKKDYGYSETQKKLSVSGRIYTRKK
jgi:hypothetical protein